MERIRKERHMRIACIGAGASGLCFAYKLQRSFDDFTLTIFDHHSTVGGVWFANRYPGCACDYEAHNYTFSWEQKSDWTSVYAGAAEVQQYFSTFAEKHGLLQYCKFNTTVTKAQWDDVRGCWSLELKETSGMVFTCDCDILINASGVLSNAKWPDIQGLNGFGGLKLHSAAWPSPSPEIAGQRIGLIGNGSSGQQLLEALQPNAGHLTVFIRQPTWVLGPFGEQPRRYSADELSTFKDEPEKLLAKRKQFENRVNSYFGICIKDNPQQAALRRHLTQKIEKQLAESKYKDLDKDLFIPQYAVGCRRPTPGTEYIKSLSADNVTLAFGSIRQITTDSVVDQEGKEHRLDMLICATGFDTSHRPSFPILGKNSKDLRDLWSQGATAYLALAVADFPNYFVFYGPNNPFASGAFLSTVEAQADYMLKWCDRWQTENIHSFAPKQQAVDEFYDHAARIIENTVWSDSCRSWYKASPQPNKVSLWPGSGLHYMEAISSLRGDDFDVRYSGNRWGWLGSGYSQVEQDEECDLSYYIRTQDESEFLSSKKRRRASTKGCPVDRGSLHVIG
ncbi:FAD/NAD(P)-binding domain-containing protein [Truncatella angustata]|uniref:FAD/NAD(P)-binding domain-containing protein n=1 Tax=Truncatella angustata TaxID=152316 RepID=A0A9P8RJJ2_9PEZI|nr:FAD/NAD(P)-binding domain-containing protein [Truncatella angustata]KAH6639970.1 FAD/NAD(P)-binding domain-containing protein [Truncatella angustata]